MTHPASNDLTLVIVKHIQPATTVVVHVPTMMTNGTRMFMSLGLALLGPHSGAKPGGRDQALACETLLVDSPPTGRFMRDKCNVLWVAGGLDDTIPGSKPYACAGG